MTMLSVLMPTTPERASMFLPLFNELHRQIEYCATFHPSLGSVEVLVDPDKRFLDGGPSIGQKRESLKNRATGRYLCYLDSDEGIAPNYVESILRLCNQGADICTFRAFVSLKSFWALVDMRLAYKVNDQITPDYTVRRPGWHMCPVKSVFAKLHSFNDKNNAEDFEWMEKVLGQCTTEAHTDKILFMYRHGDHSEADQIPLP